MPRPLPLNPSERLNRRKTLPFDNQVVDGFERKLLRTEARNRQQEYGVFADAGSLGRLEGRLEKRNTGEDALSA